MQTSAWLFSQVDNFRALGRRFRPGDAAENLERIQPILIGIVVFFGIGLLIFGIWRLFRKRWINSPIRLFWQLCRAHRLCWKQRFLLLRIAQQRKLRNAGLLFVEAVHFDSVAHSGPLAVHRKQLETLRDTLFATRLREKSAG